MSATPRTPWADFRTRISTAAVSIAVGVAVLLTLSAIVHESRTVRQNLLVTGQQLAAHLAHNSVIPVLAGDRDQTEKAARALLEVPDVAQVLVYRRGGPFARVERDERLYVILDVFSRYVVGWMVADGESAVLAKRLIEEICQRQGIEPNQLTLHADRGSSMISEPVAFLLADLGVTKTHSRPHVSDDNPFSTSSAGTTPSITTAASAS